MEARRARQGYAELYQTHTALLSSPFLGLLHDGSGYLRGQLALIFN